MKNAPTCVNRLGTTTAGSSNFDCNNARSWNPLCWHALACCASNCTLLSALPCFFRSRYVRAATLLSISQARKWSPSLRSLKKSKSPVILTCLKAKNQHFLGCLSTSSSLRRFTVADGCLRMNCIAARNQTFALYLSLKLSVLPLHADLPWKVLVVSNHALLKSFLQRKKQSLPNVRLHVWCRIVDRSMDPEVLTASGQVPHDEACRSLRTSTVFGRLPTCRHQQLARLTSLSFVRVGNESRF